MGQCLAKRVVEKLAAFRRITVKVNNNRRAFHVNGADYVEVDRIASPPLYAQQFPGELWLLIFLAEQNPDLMWSLIAEFNFSPVSRSAATGRCDWMAADGDEGGVLAV